MDLLFVWQARQLRYWAGSGDACGRSRLALRLFCVAGVALGDIFLRFHAAGVAGVALGDLHFVWPRLWKHHEGKVNQQERVLLRLVKVGVLHKKRCQGQQTCQVGREGLFRDAQVQDLFSKVRVRHGTKDRCTKDRRCIGDLGAGAKGAQDVRGCIGTKDHTSAKMVRDLHRTQLLAKVFSSSATDGAVTDVIRQIEYSVARYTRMMSTVRTAEDLGGLRVEDGDMLNMLVKSLPSAVRDYALIHAQTATYPGFKQAARWYENQHRLFKELNPGKKAVFGVVGTEETGDPSPSIEGSPEEGGL
eukprot:s4288_g1.t1